MIDIDQILQHSPVIPVVTIEASIDAVALARALFEGGISIIEVTLRTDAALGAIEKIHDAMPEICLGAGTVWTRDQALKSVDAGISFIVSPGIADDVFDTCREHNIAILPGAQTVSEVAHWQHKNVRAVKFFPAQAAGGASMLRAFSTVFPEIQFCPTGGITESTAVEYLDLPCVPCVGGSWLTPSSLLRSGDWAAVTKLVRDSLKLLHNETIGEP